MTQTQLFAYHGDWLFTEVITDRVYSLTKNFRVQCEKFKSLLERVRKNRTTEEDAEKSMKLHYGFYRHNEYFKQNIEHHKKTMWLFSGNANVRRKMSTSLSKLLSQGRFPLQGLNVGTTQTKHKAAKKNVHICHILTQPIS